jgi:hypothetical protein
MAHPLQEIDAPLIPGGVRVAPPQAGPQLTYQQLYGDPQRQRAVNLPEYMAGYRFDDDAEGVAPPTAATLHERTVQMCERWPFTFMCLTTRGETQVVQIMHRFMRYLDIPGEAPTGFNDTVLALLGDIRPGLYPVVDAPSTVFGLVATPANVPTEDTILAAIEEVEEENPPANNQLLGPYADRTAGTEAVRPRMIQLLPNQFAPLFLQNDGLPPLVAYRTLREALIEANALEACGDVLTWLRAACTRRGGGGNRAAIPSVNLNVTAVHPPRVVYEFLMSKVQADLPDTRPGAGGVPGAGAGAVGGIPAGADLAGLVRALAEVRGQEARGRPAEDEREPKRINEVYRETYTTLLRHCRVERPDEVAPLWRRLANAAKGEQQAIIQHELSKVCLIRGLAPELYCPVVTTAVKQTIITFTFAGSGIDDLTSGCNPFLVSYSGAKAQQEAREVANLSLQLDQGVNQATLADVRSIRDKEKVRLPRDLHQVAVTLQRYAVLAHTLFQSEVGPRHPLVRALWHLAETFAARLPFLAERHHAQPPGEVYNSYPTRILRHVQVRTSEYFQRIASANAGFDAVDNAPSFDEMLEDLGHGNFPTARCWLPLPPEYASMFTPPTTSSGATLSTAHTTVPTSVARTTAGASASGISSVSGDGTANTPRPVQQREANPNPDPGFLDLQLRPRLGELLRLHRPPTNAAGQEYCVSWWAKGACNTQCSRRATHGPFASPAERNKLLNHVKAHLVVTAPNP